MVLTEAGASSVALLVRHNVFSEMENAKTTSVIGISDAYYCAECTRLEKDRDGCPKIVNLGASRTDLFYERRRLGTLELAWGYFVSFVLIFSTGFKKG